MPSWRWIGSGVGLASLTRLVWPGARLQRHLEREAQMGDCVRLVHLQQNASAYVPRQDLKAEVAADLRAIFTAPTQADAQVLLARTIAKYTTSASKLATWLDTAVPAGLTVFAVPPAHRPRLRTVNALERFNQELRRRTRVVRIFPNEASCLRLVTALAMETSDDWEAGKVYLTLAD